ncbi:hypothetical protein CTAM01_10717 [Colletotrichum tamarilloi]|uniref:Cyanovirin-N domain-containing protein n=1 Tax=Colletotrichum tamarilloi TaxID=1209934 RepID=A0ABQ9R0A1_9PEZI|nr:uncharacterized protein CTAM01_10717 [Colletotrichum tamarilloi]KAK1490428.1 hypothetical protein CTAM01_10717 [Colletotrichum tamarilloi]
MHITVVLSLLAAAAVQVAAKDFSATCFDTYYESTTVTSSCFRTGGDSGYTTRLDMTKCLANVGGKLVCRPSNPSFKYCDCGIADKKILNCRCTDSKGIKQQTSIDLDTCLSNNDSELECK